MGNVSFESKSSKGKEEGGAFEGIGIIIPVLMGIVILINGILSLVRKDSEAGYALDGIWKIVYSILFVAFILACLGVFFGNCERKTKRGSMAVFLVILLLQGITIGILLAVNKSVAVANTVIEVIKWIDRFEGVFNIIFWCFAILFLVAFFGSIILLLSEKDTRLLLLIWLGVMILSYVVLFVIFMFASHRVLTTVLLAAVVVIALFFWIASKLPASTSASSSGSRSTKQKRASYYSSSDSGWSSSSSSGSGSTSSGSGGGVDPNAREKKKLQEAIRKNKEEIARCEKRLEDYYKKGPNAASTFDIDPKAMQSKIDRLKKDVAIDEKKLEKLG